MNMAPTSGDTTNKTSNVSIEMLKVFEPICGMTDGRLSELAQLCHVETIAKGENPFRSRGLAGQSVYLVAGILQLSKSDGSSDNLSSEDAGARYPLGRRGTEFESAQAMTDVSLIRIDEDLLDIMVTWDQLASVDSTQSRRSERDPSSNWSILSGMFSVSNLKYGAFSRLPTAHIEELLARFKRLEMHAGDSVIKEGAEGDYYYVIESGRCIVERMIGGVSMRLAELKSGDAFGEEALVSEAKRNATITMKTDGVLLRLDKKDFIELLREPLLLRISPEDARQKIINGGQWLDVRYPSEYQYDKLPDAMNIPLAEIRNAFGVLDKEKEYVVYCQSERRSSAAAFLLAQNGYRAFLLQGGLWAGER